MVIDHIGIVVRSLEEGIEQWTSQFGYRKRSAIVLNTRQKVRVVFLSKDNSLTVKLIEPAAADSPISAFARKGGGLHHLCFRCDDLAITIRTVLWVESRAIPDTGIGAHGSRTCIRKSYKYIMGFKCRLYL